MPWPRLSRKLLVSCLVGFFCLSAIVVVAQQGYKRETTVLQLINGLVMGEERLSGMSRASATAVQVGGSDVTTLNLVTGSVTRTLTASGVLDAMPATQTIAATDTIAADACGGVKRISAAGAVTTNTTNTITAPAAANTGCQMMVCNVGANTITLDKNANILLQGGADVALLASSCVGVFSNGTVWMQTSAQQTST